MMTTGVLQNKKINFIIDVQSCTVCLCSSFPLFTTWVNVCDGFGPGENEPPYAKQLIDAVAASVVSYAKWRSAASSDTSELTQTSSLTLQRSELQSFRV